MIDFLFKNFNFLEREKLLSGEDLYNRLREKGTLVLWGYFNSRKNKLVCRNGRICEIKLFSRLNCFEFTKKSPRQEFIRFIAFTSKEKAELYFRQAESVGVDIPESELDLSTYYTEVYD